MADLDMKDAELAAGQLTTIGHPMKPEWLLATAQDLNEWCKGGIYGGVPWTPAQQANALVQKARLTFGEWSRAGGTTALYALFQQMFPPKTEKAAEWKPLTLEQTIERGLIRPPCEVCGDDLVVGVVPNLLYCTACPAGRHQARWEGERGLARLNHPEATKPSRDFATAAGMVMTPETVRRVIEDEVRRRREQYEKLGIEAD